MDALWVSRREMEDWFPNHLSSKSPSVEACCGTKGCDGEEYTLAHRSAQVKGQVLRLSRGSKVENTLYMVGVKGHQVKVLTISGTMSAHLVTPPCSVCTAVVLKVVSQGKREQHDLC